MMLICGNYGAVEFRGAGRDASRETRGPGFLAKRADQQWDGSVKWIDHAAARLMVVVLSGVAYALSFPPVGWGWLICPGVGGLMWAVRGRTMKTAWYLGLLHGLVVYGTGLSWLVSLFGPFAFALWCVMAVFHGLFALFLARAGAVGWKGWRWAVLAGVNWGAWEFIRAELFPLKFPWMTVGLAVGPNSLLPVIGVYGVGVVLVFAVALACERRWKAAMGLAACLGAAVVSFGKHPDLSDADPAVVKTGGIQFEEMMLEDFIEATRRLPDDVRYVVWPEYAVAHDIRRHAKDWGQMLRLCADRGITVTFGTQQSGQGNEWRNIALTMDATGERGFHNKNHTVHFFNDGMPGTEAHPVETRHGRVGTPICFDCDYEGMIRRMTRAGAQLYMIPVMDHQSWTRRQHEQHGELFRIRAAENGRWLFVCATSGASKVIDPHGHVHEQLAAMEQGSLVGRVARREDLTIYTRVGWIFPWLVLGMGVLMWLALVMGVPRSRPESKRRSGRIEEPME